MDRHIWCLRCRKEYKEQREEEMWLCPACEEHITISYLRDKRFVHLLKIVSKAIKKRKEQH